MAPKVLIDTNDSILHAGLEVVVNATGITKTVQQQLLDQVCRTRQGLEQLPRFNCSWTAMNSKVCIEL
jgi:hypothetical protein